MECGYVELDNRDQERGDRQESNGGRMRTLMMMVMIVVVVAARLR